MPEKTTLQRLLPAHYKILELALAGMGRKEIAAAMGRSEAGIGLILNDPRFRDELARRRQSRVEVIDEEAAASLADVRVKMETLASKAADRLGSLMDSEHENMKFKSSKSILDIVFGRGDAAGKDASIVINADQVQLLQLALQEG